MIYTCPDLALISDELGAHYKLGGNINASGGDWTPIGDNTNRFTGSLDGNGYLIDGLTVNITASSGDADGGFFGYIGLGAVISNIALQDVSIIVNKMATLMGPMLAGWWVRMMMEQSATAMPQALSMSLPQLAVVESMLAGWWGLIGNNQQQLCEGGSYRQEPFGRYKCWRAGGEAGCWSNQQQLCHWSCDL